MPEVIQSTTRPNVVEIHLPGPQGPRGYRGTVWRSGTGAPAGALGDISDWYLDKDNSDVYEKIDVDTWVLRDNIRGRAATDSAQLWTRPHTYAMEAGTNVPITIQANVSQSVDLLRWTNSAGTVLGGVSSQGNLISNNLLNFNAGEGRISQAGNLALRLLAKYAGTLGDTSFFQFGDAHGMFTSLNGQAMSSFGIASLGTQIYDGAHNNVSAPAGLLHVKMRLSPAKPVLVVQGATSQTADLQQWQTDTGTVRSRVASDGTILTAGAGIYSNTTGAEIPSQFASKSAAATVVAGIFRGASSQSVDVTQWQNSSGTLIARVSASGSISTSGVLQVGTFVYNDAPAAIGVVSAEATRVGVIVKGAASQTGSLQQWQNSSGTILASIDANGNLWSASASNPQGGVGQRRSATFTADGWYRIASNAGDRAAAVFTVFDTTSGRHNWIKFSVSRAYGGRPHLTILEASRYSTETFSQVRVVDNSTYDPAYIEVYLTSTGSTVATSINTVMESNYWVGGWTLLDIVAGSIPTTPAGYKAYTYAVTERAITTSGQVIALGGSLSVADSAAVVVGRFRGAANQTGDLTQWQNSAGTILSRVAANGALYVGASRVLTEADMGGSGTGVVTLDTTQTITGLKTFTDTVTLNSVGPATLNINADTGNDAAREGDNASLRFSQDGGLTWFRAGIGSDNHPYFDNNAYDYRFLVNGGEVARIGTAGVNTLGGTAASPGFAFTADTDTGMYSPVANELSFSAGGVQRLHMNATATYLIAPSASAMGLLVRAAASQTADIQQWQNSAGAVLARVSSAGQIFEGANRVYSAGNPQTSIAWSGVTAKPSGWLNGATLIEEAPVDINALGNRPSGFFQRSGGTNSPNGSADWFNYINVRHANTLNNHGFQIGASYYANRMYFRIYRGGTGVDTGITYETWAEIATLNTSQTFNSTKTFEAPTASSIPVTVRGAASQSANLQNWVNSAGTAVAHVAPSGSIISSASLYAQSMFSGGMAWASGISLGVSTAGTGNVGVMVRGVANQSGDLQQWQNSAGTVLSRVNNQGWLVETFPGVVLTTGSGTADYGFLTPLATRAWFDRTRFTVPTWETSADGTTFTSLAHQAHLLSGRTETTSNIPSGGAMRVTWSGMSWSDISALFLGFSYIGVGNSVRVLIEYSADNVTWRTGFDKSGLNASANGQYIRPNAFISGDQYLRLTIFATTADGTTAVRVNSIQFLSTRMGDQGGGVQNDVPYSWNGMKTVVFQGVDGSIVPLISRGRGGQTGNLQEWQDSAGNTLARVASNGDIYVGSAKLGSTPTNMVTTDTAQTISGAKTFNSVNAFVTEQRFSSGTYNDPDIGVARAIKVGLGGVAVRGGIKTDAISSVAGSATTVPIIAQGAASQTADLQRWTDSSAAAFAIINSTGSIRTRSGVHAGDAQFDAISGTSGIISSDAGGLGPTFIPFVARGAASQTADLQQWQDSAGNVLARVANDGTIYKGNTAVGSGGNATDTEIMAIMGAF